MKLSNEQPGAGEQHDHERDLRGDERASHALRSSSARAAADALAQRAADGRA